MISLECSCWTHQSQPFDHSKVQLFSYSHRSKLNPPSQDVRPESSWERSACQGLMSPSSGADLPRSIVLTPLPVPAWAPNPNRENQIFPRKLCGGAQPWTAKPVKKENGHGRGAGALISVDEHFWCSGVELQPIYGLASCFVRDENRVGNERARCQRWRLNNHPRGGKACQTRRAENPSRGGNAPWPTQADVPVRALLLIGGRTHRHLPSFPPPCRSKAKSSKSQVRGGGDAPASPDDVSFPIVCDFAPRSISDASFPLQLWDAAGWGIRSGSPGKIPMSASNTRAPSTALAPAQVDRKAGSISPPVCSNYQFRFGEESDRPCLMSDIFSALCGCRCRRGTDGGKNPTFQEKFVFNLIEGLREINVSVWNSNSLTYDDHIGSGK